MASQLINHTLANIAGGVSEQFEEARFETQVEEMENCIPNIARGIVRRNPIQGLITTMIRNPVTGDITYNNPSSYSDWFIHSYLRGDGYKYVIMIGKKSTSPTETGCKALIGKLSPPGEVSMWEYVSLDSYTYFTIPSTSKPKDCFEAVTVGDFTFIINKTKTIAKSATVDGTVDSHLTTGVYWIKKTSNTTTKSDPSSGGSIIEGYKYTLNGTSSTAIKNTIDSSSDLLRGEQLASNLATALGYTSSGPVVYKTGLGSSTTWEWSDSYGNEASFGFKGKAKALTDLPVNLPVALNGLIVNITGGTDDQFDDFYLKYENQTWTETLKPGMANTLDASTMPHVFVRGSDNNFYVKSYTTSELSTVPGLNTTTLGWKKRTVGNEDTAPDPTFIGKKASEIIFYKNRLGIIAGDSVVFSELGEYGNFYNTTVRSIPDTDTIDLTVASTTVANIFAAVSTSSALVLFSDTAQYVVTSTGVLSPTTAQIEVASRYNVSTICKPLGLGNRIFFITTSGNNSQLYAYQLNEGQLPTNAIQLSSHVPNYLPSSIEKIEGHSILGYLILKGPNSNYLYLVNIADNGQQLTQVAFHKWKFTDRIGNISILDNSLYMSLYKESSLMSGIGTITLEPATNFDNIEYVDESLGVVVQVLDSEYTSKIVFTKWFMKDGNNNGNRVGRVILRTANITTKEDSYYKTIINTPYLTREYTNDSKISVLSNSENVNLEIQSIGTHPFELKTINYEGLYHSRSQRY